MSWSQRQRKLTISSGGRKLTGGGSVATLKVRIQRLFVRLLVKERNICVSSLREMDDGAQTEYSGADDNDSVRFGRGSCVDGHLGILKL